MKNKDAPFGNPWWVVTGSAVALTVGQGPVMFFTFGTFLGPITSEFGWNRGTISSALLVGYAVAAMVSPMVFEQFQAPFYLNIQRDVNEDHQPELNRRRIEERGVLADNAAVLERTHPSQTWRGRQADAVRELNVADPAVALQLVKDLQVDLVKAV